MHEKVIRKTYILKCVQERRNRWKKKKGSRSVELASSRLFTSPARGDGTLMHHSGRALCKIVQNIMYRHCECGTRRKHCMHQTTSQAEFYRRGGGCKAKEKAADKTSRNFTSASYSTKPPARSENYHGSSETNYGKLNVVQQQQRACCYYTTVLKLCFVYCTESLKAVLEGVRRSKSLPRQDGPASSFIAK